MTSRESIIKRIQKLTGENEKPKTIVWVEGELIPPHRPRDIIVSIEGDYAKL